MGKTVGSLLKTGATLVATAVGYAIGGPVGAAAAAALTTIALSVAFPAPQPRAETARTAVRTERPPRVSAYGRLKLSGAYILYETNGQGVAVDAWAFHDGRIDAIEGWYLGDTRVTIDGNGFVQEGTDRRYAGPVIQIGANLGAAVGVAHQPVINALPGVWTAQHRGDGVVTGFMISKPVKAKEYQEVYADGGPNQTPLAIIMRAQLVFDWRDNSQSVTDPLSWKWSENWVLHLAHYQLVRNGKSWARHFVPTLDYWTAAADDADVAMPLKNGGTEPRYRSCVSHHHAGDGSEHKSIIASLLACGDGWMAPREDGALVLYSGRYYTPTVTIGPDQITTYTIENGIEDENAINSINVTYISDQHDFNEVDTDPWTDEDDILVRGALRSTDLKNQVPSHAQARRLAKRSLAKTMAFKRGSLTTTSAGAAMLSERFINLRLVEGEGTDDEFAPYIGPAEITALSRNLQTGAVSASWIAADPNVDAWNPATEEGEPSPAEDRVAREPLDAPMIISATAQYSAVGQTPEGDEVIDPTPGQTATGARVLIAATGPDRADLTWYGRWRVGTSGSWNEREYSDADPGPGVSFTTEFVPLATNVNVEAAYTTGDGRLSPWSAPTAVDTTTAP